MAFIDPSDLTFTGKEIREAAEIIIKELVEIPEVEQFLTVKEDVVASEKVGFADAFDKITKAYSDCEPTFGSKQISMSEKTWSPAKVEILDKQCLDDLEQTFFVYLKNKGKDAESWDKTEFIKFYIQFIAPAMGRDLFRLVWFGDKAAANYNDSPAGVISNGTDITDMNIIDGLFKQVFSIATTTPARKVTISKNTQSTYANQTFDSTDITNKVASIVYRDLIQKADPRLRSRADKVILSTRSLADQYQNELESQGVSESFKMITDGVSVLKRNSIEIYAIDAFDAIIDSDFNNGTKWYLPHRAVLMTKSNMFVGVDAKSSLKSWNTFYVPQERNNYLMGGYKLDAKVYQDHLVQVAY
ncbi:MAG: hypothetical protein K1X55_17390 [Chitinophagales bacterium]|nr:hypothetical protein [Chitinophagales bacterium]